MLQAQIAVFDRLLQVAFLIQQDLDHAFADTALTPARTHLLWEAHRRGPVTQRELATALDVTPRNVTALVDGLEGSGYVVRRPHPSDRRATLIELTELGATTMAAMGRDREQLATEVTAGLDRDRLDRLDADLGLIAERWQGLLDRARAERPPA